MEAENLFLETKVANTRRAYKAALEQFKAFGGSRRSSTKDALEFVILLQSRGASWATVRSRLGAIAAYFDFLIALNAADRNPIRDVRPLIPKRQRRQVRPTATLEPDAVRTILEAPARDTKTGIRNAALLASMFGGGLRRSEAMMLNVGDIEVTPEACLVLRLQQTKAGITQYQTIGPAFAETVSALIAQRKTSGAKNDSPLFCFYYQDGRPGRRLSGETIYKIFKRYAQAAGKEAAPHSARAAAITQLLRQGASLLDVRRFSRHTWLDSLNAYDQRSTGEVVQAMAKKLKY
jgi:site-specific recombinase XerD